MTGVDYRAEKSGIAMEAQQKIQGKYDIQLAHQLLEWMKNISGEDINTSGEQDNLLSLLKDGSFLCRFANSLEPDAIKKINKMKQPFMQMENIGFFLSFAAKHINETELFQTVDLYEGQDPNAVVTCLAALARKSEKLFGKPGVGPKEAAGEKREWTEEQLRAGQNIIGLQMGTNQCANATGINFGNTRHM